MYKKYKYVDIYGYKYVDVIVDKLNMEGGNKNAFATSYIYAISMT